MITPSSGPGSPAGSCARPAGSRAPRASRRASPPSPRAGCAGAGQPRRGDGEARRDYFTTREISNAIRAEAGPIYDAEQITYGSNSAFGKPVSVSLVGSNLEELDAAAQLIKSELERLEELSDVIDNNLDGLREIEITLKDKARYLGLNLQEIVGQVRRGFFGSESTL